MCKGKESYSGCLERIGCNAPKSPNSCLIASTREQHTNSHIAERNDIPLMHPKPSCLLLYTKQTPSLNAGKHEKRSIQVRTQKHKRCSSFQSKHRIGYFQRGEMSGRNIVHGKQSKDFSVVLWCLYLSFSSWPFTEIVWSTAIVSFLLVGWCLVRSEMPKGTPEIFYRTVQFWEDVNPPPVFVGSVFLQLRTRTATKFTSSMSSATACTLSFPQRYGRIGNVWVLE